MHWALKSETAEEQDLDLGARMAASLWYFWILVGTFKEGRSWLAAALRHTPQLNQTRARLLMADGILAWQEGNLSTASSSLRESIDLFRTLDDQPGLAEATHMGGHIVFDEQNYQRAERLFCESLDIYQSLGDSINQITLISDLGLVASHQSDLPSARQYYEKSLALYIKKEIKDGEAASYIRLGDIDRLEGAYEKADVYYRKSLAINRELNISIESACAVHKLGFTALHRGEILQAQTYFIESLAIQHKIGNQQGIAECLAGLASLKVFTEDYEEAAHLFGASKQILTRTGLPMAPADLAEWQRDEAVARSKSDPDHFEQAWLVGMEETMDDLVTSLLAETSIRR